MNNTDLNFIDSAKQHAREAIHETWPTAVEVAEPIAGMYEFDAIMIDHEACPIGSVSIMHDPDHFYWWTETLMGQLPASPPTCCNDRQAN